MLKYEWWPLTKSVLSFDIIVGRTFSSLWAKIFAKMASIFKREIGLYEAHSVGSYPFLAMSMIQASENDCGREPCLKELDKIKPSCGESKLENCLKNSVGKPLGPGHLPDCIKDMAMEISIEGRVRLA